LEITIKKSKEKNNNTYMMVSSQRLVQKAGICQHHAWPSSQAPTTIVHSLKQD
jgi:hypothetical protein